MGRRRTVWGELQRERERKRKAVAQAQRRWEQETRQAQREYAQQRRAEERAAAANDREQKRLYIEGRKAEAADLTADVDDRIAELESVLSDGLQQSAGISFDELKEAFEESPFDPGDLDQPLPEPKWEEVAPQPSSLLGRLTGGAERRRQLKAARQEHERLLANHVINQANRNQELDRRWRAHRQAVVEARQEHEASIDAFAAGVRAGEQGPTEEFFKLVLDASPFPEGFLHLTRVVYLPHARDLVIEFELPHQEVIPVDREYRYLQTKDRLDAVARPIKEVKQRYADLIAQVALRTLHEVFEADQFDVLDTVTFVGLVSTVHKATGQPIRPSLLSVGVDRVTFSGLVLAEVDPVTCLKHLNALVSPHPYDLEGVAPIVDFEALLKQYKFVDDFDVLANLDSRQDLLDLTPTEFEHFTKQLFEKMGMKAWNTVASKDDGVDAVATSEAPVFGGLCVIQAKRYSRAVPVEAVRALAGTMEDKHATKGVMVTTSWVTRDGHAFAKRHGRIEILEGPHLKDLCLKHLDRDVLISLPKPPPRRPG